MEVNIALIQMRCEKGAIDQNIKSMAEYINECKLKKAEIIIFPEMNITGYINPDKYPYAVITREHSAINRVAELSKEYEVVIIAGFVEKNPEGKPFITQFAAQNGEINGFYRKKTVKDQEAEWFSLGDDVLVLENSNMNYGISICADIDDENIFKELSQNGANIIFECAAPGLYGEQETRNWQSGYDWWKGECHNKLGKYAYENKIYIAASTQAGRTTDEDFPGGGYLFSPEGKCISESDNWKEGILFANVEIIDENKNSIIELEVPLK